MNTLREARLRRDLNNVASQVEHLLARLGDESADRMSDWRDRMSSMASHLGSNAGSRLSSLNSSMRDGALQAAKVTDTYVRDNPWRVIGAGAAIGLLIGYLASRR